MGSDCCGSSHGSAKTVSKEELKEKLKQGAAQVVNVLEPKWDSLGSIEGSVKIPVSQLEKRAGELDKGKEVITYCASHDCSASREGAEKLAALGFKVRAYEGGLKEWKESGLPVAQKQHGSGSCCGA